MDNFEIAVFIIMGTIISIALILVCYYSMREPCGMYPGAPPPPKKIRVTVNNERSFKLLNKVDEIQLVKEYKNLTNGLGIERDLREGFTFNKSERFWFGLVTY
jgi:hypothetical protein